MMKACAPRPVRSPRSISLADPSARVDTHGYTGYAVVPRFDSLLATLIMHSNSDHLAHAAQRTRHVLDEFRPKAVIDFQGTPWHASVEADAQCAL